MGNDVIYGEATSTLAFLNMNWDVVNGKDIYKVCEDLVGSECVREVKICKTKFNTGEPKGGLLEGPKGKTEHLEIIKRSFVALVRLDTVSTAIKIYNELDSTELENSRMFFDLRFVSDEIKTGEVVEVVVNGEGFVEKDYNSSNKEGDEERERNLLLKSLFKAKETNRGLLNKLVSISDDEDCEEVEEKKKLLVGEEKVKAVREGVKLEPKPAFDFDVSDSRFAQVYTDSDFTIDPTHPEFAKNKKLKDLILEKRRRHET